MVHIPEIKAFWDILGRFSEPAAFRGTHPIYYKKKVGHYIVHSDLSQLNHRNSEKTNLHVAIFPLSKCS